MSPNEQGGWFGRGRGRPPSPLPANLSTAEREFLERMRDTNRQAGRTLAEVSRGLDEVAADSRHPRTAASTSELSKMLSGRRCFRPDVITGLHTLVANRSDSYNLQYEIAHSMALFRGWLKERDPGRLQVMRLEEELWENEELRREAEIRAAQFGERLDEVRHLWRGALEQLSTLAGEAFDDLSGHRQDIAVLTATVQHFAKEVHQLEEALRRVWEEIRVYTHRGIQIVLELGDELERLTEVPAEG
ncbi:hypothetical protein GCM10009731_00330 [Streptomyces globosus]